MICTGYKKAIKNDYSILQYNITTRVFCEYTQYCTVQHIFRTRVRKEYLVKVCGNINPNYNASNQFYYPTNALIYIKLRD